MIRPRSSAISCRQSIPIVLMTGWADELDPAQTPGVETILPKPFSRERLFEAMAQAVPNRVRG